jgi:hypothetical protein
MDSDSAVADTLNVVAKPYHPIPWEHVSLERQQQWKDCDALLQSALANATPTYAELAAFTHMQPAVAVRPAICNFVEKRGIHSYTIAQETAALSALPELPAWLEHIPLYDVARRVWQALTGRDAPARDFALSIAYLPWLRLPPIDASTALLHHQPRIGAPRAYVAAQAFLLVLTAHPFPDGNGRVSRLIFNGYLRGSATKGYLPLADILRSGKGAWEELLAQAAVDGDYATVENYLLTALDSYAQFVLGEVRNQIQTDPLAAALAQRNDQFHTENALHRFPHVISLDALCRSGSSERNWELLWSLTAIATDLAHVADVLYAACGIVHLSAAEPTPVPLLMVVAAQPADLLLRARELKPAMPGMLHCVLP